MGCMTDRVLFWEGGNAWLPGHDDAYVTIFEAGNPELVEAVVQRLRQLRLEGAMPPVDFIVYRSAHRQPKLVFREVNIE